MNLKSLLELGQSIWLDYIRRHLLRSGQLAALIREQVLRGVTSNPSIFEKAIAGSTDYTDAIAKLADHSAGEIYEQLAVEDIRAVLDHGRARATLEQDLDHARAVLDALPKYGIELSEVTDHLTAEGVDAFGLQALAIAIAIAEALA